MYRLIILIITMLAFTMASCSNGVGINDQNSEDMLQSTSVSLEKKSSRNGKKIEICHESNRRANISRTLTIPRKAAQRHLANHPNDRIGNCDIVPNTAPTISYEGGSDLTSLGNRDIATILISASDIDGDELTVDAVLTVGSARLGLDSISASGVYSFSLSPLDGVGSSGTVTFTVSDGTTTSSLSLDYLVSEE